MDFFKKMPKDIFQSSFWSFRWVTWWKPKYRIEHLKAAMLEHFKNKKPLEMNGSLLVAVTTYDQRSTTNLPTLFANYFDYRVDTNSPQILYDLPLYDCATATAAAPTYFGSVNTGILD